MQWPSTRGIPVRPMITLDQLWRLAKARYGNRLTVESRRPVPDETAKIGLTGPFWDPKSDQWLKE